MKFTPEVVSAALINILRERQLRSGMCIGMETLWQAWQGTGLRKSDLPLALREVEQAGFVHVRGQESLADVELSADGAELLVPRRRPNAAVQAWMDDVDLYRISQRARENRADGHRRAGDKSGSAFG